MAPRNTVSEVLVAPWVHSIVSTRHVAGVDPELRTGGLQPTYGPTLIRA